VTWEGWEAIDLHEKTSGEPHGRPRVKLVRLTELVERAKTIAERR
jgi:ferredoxin--NADP+ reductase